MPHSERDGRVQPSSHPGGSQLLLRSLDERGVDYHYLLIGGYALAAHGYQRATIDIDLLVPGNAASGQRIKDALMVLPDQAARDLEPEWFADGEDIRVADAYSRRRCIHR